MSTFDANQLCILTTSNLHCHGDSSAFSSLMPNPLSFRLEVTQVLNTLLVQIFYLRQLYLTACFAFYWLVCCTRYSIAFFFCQRMTFISHVRIELLAILLSFINAKSDSYTFTCRSAALPYLIRGRWRMPERRRSPCTPGKLRF